VREKIPFFRGGFPDVLRCDEIHFDADPMAMATAMARLWRLLARVSPPPAVLGTSHKTQVRGYRREEAARLAQRNITRPRINHEIQSELLRVLWQKGRDNEVMGRIDALRKAKEAGLDLVEVDARAQPPVCRVMDFSKFRFEQSKKEKDAKRKQMERKKLDEVKEVQLKPRIEEHDLEVKMTHLQRFLEKGHKVKLVVRLTRGIGKDGQKLGRELLERVIGMVEDKVLEGAEINAEGARVTTMVAPKPELVAAARAAIESINKHTAAMEKRTKEKESSGTVRDGDHDAEPEQEV